MIREIVLKNEKPFVPLRIERGRGETQLFVKEVTADRARYIVCRNEAEAEKDRADRQAIMATLAKRLSDGDKVLIGNAGYRRYLRRTDKGAAFEIDAGKLAEEARFDGIFALRTNTSGWQRWLLIRRSRKDPEKQAYYLVFCPVATSLAELADAAGLRWTIEDCFQRAKDDLGLDHCETRSWHGWHRHMSLVMAAAAFLAKLSADMRRMACRKRNKSSPATATAVSPP